MAGAPSSCIAAARRLIEPGHLQRADGRLVLAVARRDERTAIARLRQQGCLKLLFPRSADTIEAVIVNLSGGIVGGDRLDAAIEAGPRTSTIVTTQAAERCYRARVPAEYARVALRFDLADASRLEWLPMETILFEGSALDRSLTVDVAGSATFLAVESRVFGRTAHGERPKAITLRDRFVIRRDGRPLLIEALRLDDEGEAMLSRAATAGGAIATATIALVSPDAAARLGAVRAALGPDAAASAWNGMLVVRVLSRDASEHRRLLIRVLTVLRDDRPLPPIWRC